MFHEKAKKNGARCRQSAAAPLLYSNHSFSLAFLRMVSFAAFTKSAIMRISYSSQSETRSCISCEKISLECITLSHKNSSTETERAFAKDTIVGKLNLELPVSMLLMCVVESDAFSANASCVKSALIRAIFMRLPIAL